MADDPIHQVREADPAPVAGADPLAPAPPPGDGKPDAPRKPKTPSALEGYSDNEGAMSPLSDTTSGDGDY